MITQGEPTVITSGKNENVIILHVSAIEWLLSTRDYAKHSVCILLHLILLVTPWGKFIIRFFMSEESESDGKEIGQFVKANNNAALGFELWNWLIPETCLLTTLSSLS